MMFASKILGILLPLAVVIAPSTTGALADAGHASAPLAVPGHPPAACHMHVDNTLPDSSLPHPPRPAPASYQCCLTGHNAAVVQTSLSPQPCNERARVAVQSSPRWRCPPVALKPRSFSPQARPVQLHCGSSLLSLPQIKNFGAKTLLCTLDSLVQ